MKVCNLYFKNDIYRCDIKVYVTMLLCLSRCGGVHMANVGFVPEEPTPLCNGTLFTFIVPASAGCDLKCRYCLISQRAEIKEHALQPSDYADFIQQISAVEQAAAIAIQGHEPLLPASLPYTVSILAAAAERGIPATLVTNGTHLADALPHILPLKPNRIGVSLDAASAERHDRLRGLVGAWGRTVDGLKAAVAATGGASPRLTVISTLMPNRASYLTGMPERLAGLGVRDWIVNPLLTYADGGEPAAFRATTNQLLADLRALQDAADAHGVRLTIDDEFDLLRPRLDAGQQALHAGLNIYTLPKGVVVSRLLPSGHCSIGRDILHPLPKDAPRWRHGDDPAAFMSRLIEDASRRQAA